MSYSDFFYYLNNDCPHKEPNPLEALHRQFQISYLQIEYHFGFIGYGIEIVWTD